MKKEKKKKKPIKEILYTDQIWWFNCKYCKKINLLSSKEGVEQLRKFKKQRK